MVKLMTNTAGRWTELLLRILLVECMDASFLLVRVPSWVFSFPFVLNTLEIVSMMILSAQ